MVSLSTLSKKDRKCLAEIVNFYRESEEPIKDVGAIVRTLNDSGLGNDVMQKLVELRLKEMELNPSYSDIMGELQGIIQFPTDESCIYTFTLKDGRSFSLTAENILTRLKFDASYMAATSKVPIGDTTTFRVFLAKVLGGQRGIQRESREMDVDEVGEAKDAILRFIEGSTISDKPEATQFSSETVWLNEGKLYIPSQTIRRILDREKFNFTMRKLRVAFDDVLLGPSKKIRVSEKTFRFWVFDMNKLNLQTKMKLVHGDEDEAPAPLPTADAQQPLVAVAPVSSPEQKSTVLGAANKKIVLLKDVPVFVGGDINNTIKLGPFKKDETIEVPTTEAEWLIKSGFAKDI